MPALVSLLILIASAAEAHGTLPGGGGFYSGALHPFVALEHLLALLTGGLILGRDGLRRPLWALGLGLAAGLWFGVALTGLMTALLAITLVFGALLALDRKLPEWVYGVGLLSVGLAVGLETDLPQPNPRMAAFGVSAAVFLITLNAFALGGFLSRSRAAVALRVAGAWMVAVALMVLALTFRGQP